MKPANDPSVDYRELVRTGYDTCAQTYTAEREHKSHPELFRLMACLPDGAHVLDIGCGGGVPISKSLSTRFQVTGVDLSPTQIDLARRFVPTGTFQCADILECDFEAESFDAVVSFYAIFHLPQEEHATLFRRISRWIKPHGYLLVTVAREQEDAYTEDDFFGATMYWSNLGLDEYIRLLDTTGFIVLDHATLRHGYAESQNHNDECHPLILTQKRGANARESTSE